MFHYYKKAYFYSCVSQLERSPRLSGLIYSLQPTLLFPHYMSATSIQLKSHRYWGWLTSKYARIFHFADNQSETVLCQRQIKKQDLSSHERWLLTLGLYR